MNTVMTDDYIDPVVFGPRQLVSSSKLVRSLGSYIDQSKKRPIFITRDQEVEAVLISLEDYRELLQEEMNVEEIYDSVVAVRRLMEHVLSGRDTISADEILKKFGMTREDLTEVDAPGEVDS